jgi:Fic family protein
VAAVEDTRPVARRLARLEREVLVDASALAGAGRTPRIAVVRDALRLEEVLSSAALGGYTLDSAAGAALLSRDVAIGGHPLERYEAVADYAAAARVIEESDPRPLRAHVFVRADDILDLHRRALRRTGRSPGAWRERNVAAVASGLVPPPHWLVPREVAAFVDRYAVGPPDASSVLQWVAGAHARLLRVQPFEGGNGRVARLVANLLLHRLGLPAAAFARRRAERYASAIARGDSGDVVPLAELTGEALHESLTRLLAATSDDDLHPLRALAPPDRLSALVKAAQRGRLRVVRRGTRFFTTSAWLAEYEAGHSGSR